MDLRTGKVFDPDGRELSQDQIANLNEKPINISGDNCTGFCALAFKRNCFTLDRKFRDKCQLLKLQRPGINRKGE